MRNFTLTDKTLAYISSSMLRQFWSVGWRAALAILAGFSVAGGAGAQQSPHGSFERECTECHTLEGWRPLRDPLEFQHDSTGFPLAGSHRAVPCTSCHESLDFPLVATACADCHADPHVGELGFACESCHVPAGWDNRREMFEVHGATLFPLVGVHATVDCAGCHRQTAPFEYALTPVECFACHAADYAGTTRPDHARVGFPTECDLCHTPIGWNFTSFAGGPGFNHDVFFALTGAHRGLDCSACHADGFFGTPTDCYGCHRGDYEGTRDPDHQAVGFPTDCESCHGTSSWQGATADHDRFFPLTGAHRSLPCEACHESGFGGTPTDCYSCHRDDYDGTRDPNHRAAGFGTACESCHTTSSWEGATVDHDRFFPLTGAHRALDCDACHGSGFAGTPRDCYSCHRVDYEGTRDPNHLAAGFPTNCELCHNTRNWGDADFDEHDSLYFPIFSGRHRGEWVSCSDCHVSASSFSVFECINCHEHQCSEMNDKHREVAGYSCVSSNCYSCHPRGEEN